MKERVSQLAGEQATRGHGRHVPRVLRASCCASTATPSACRARFTICDASDQLSAVQVGDARAARPRDDDAPVGRAGAHLAGQEPHGRRPRRSWRRRAAGADQLVGSVWQRYREHLARQRALDFDDLLLETVRLLREHEACASTTAGATATCWSTSTRTRTARSTRSCAQIGGEHRNVCVVGDDDQSIYGWRGADIRKILGFDQRLPRREGRPPADELPLDARRSSTPPTPSSATTPRATRRRCESALRRRRAGAAAAPEGREERGAVRGARRSATLRSKRGAGRRLRRSCSARRCSSAPFEARAARGRASRTSSSAGMSLLRPQGGARRRRVPEAGREPARRDVAAARHQHAAARRRQGEHRQGRSTSPRSTASRPREAFERAGEIEGLQRRGGRGIPRAALRRSTAPASPRPAPISSPRLDRFIEAIGYRDEVRRLYAEPMTREARWAGVEEVLNFAENHVSRTRRAQPLTASSRSSRSTSGDEPDEKPEQRERRGHADDAARGQGPRVPARLPGRHGGGAAARTPAPSPRAASRRSGASPTSASRARCAR